MGWPGGGGGEREKGEGGEKERRKRMTQDSENGVMRKVRIENVGDE